MGVRLFVGNLDYNVNEAELRAHFAPVGDPSQVALPVDRETGRPRGFAFVEFADRSVAEEVIQRFNGQGLRGRPLAISEARAREDRPPMSGPRPPRPPFAGGGGGGGGGAPRVQQRAADGAAAAAQRRLLARPWRARRSGRSRRQSRPPAGQDESQTRASWLRAGRFASGPADGSGDGRSRTMVESASNRLRRSGDERAARRERRRVSAPRHHHAADASVPAQRLN